ncbi:hypothetical protein SBOR_8398 [Sclerotinia borealis F-4128]|uniref:Uncharacterized protein n=1 Tax=Sclerotinia borealis (strain F-4128) TaxID=1432307 RepID=W9C8N8_SCLBF|nr:hypothetical protein SBOR_8398 [Sclerotinia borealis F-4128]
MRFSSPTITLAVLFRPTLCDIVIHEGTGSVITSISTPITYYSPSTLVSSVYPISTEATATDYYTPPGSTGSYSSLPSSTTYHTYSRHVTSEPTVTSPTTYALSTTTTSSTPSSCISPTFTWSGPTDFPTPIAARDSYRMGRRDDPPKLTPQQVEDMRKIVALWDKVEKAKPVIDRAIAAHETDCQSFKDLITLQEKFDTNFSSNYS